MAHFLRTFVVAAALLWGSGSPGLFTSVTVDAQAAVNADAAVFEAFQKRVAGYIALQKKAGAGLPTLGDTATPKQIDDYQRGLGAAIVQARKGAKKGDIFGPDMPAVIRRLLAPVFKGPEGAKIRAAIIDEPHPVVPTVNARYPDEIPLSTMPPDVLRILPKLDEGLEFRFVDRHLILLDVKSHLIVDVIDNAMPA